MSPPRLRAKKDANHDEIVEWFRFYGCEILEIYQLGDGKPDIIVYDVQKSSMHAVEIKGPKGKLTKAESEFKGFPIHIVKGELDVIDLLEGRLKPWREADAT